MAAESGWTNRIVDGIGVGAKLIIAGDGVDSWIHASVYTVRVVLVDIYWPRSPTSLREWDITMADELAKVRQLAVRLEHHWGESTVTRFANEFSIQVIQGVCYLGFYEVNPPLLSGSPEEISEQVESIKSLRAEGICRVVVPLEKMRDIVSAIQTALGQAAPERLSSLESKEEPK